MFILFLVCVACTVCGTAELFHGFVTLFSSCDLNSDAALSYSEWDNCFTTDNTYQVYKTLGSSELKFVFNMIDKDNNGIVSMQEYSAFHLNLAKQESSAEDEEESYETYGLNTEARREYESKSNKGRKFTVTNKDGRTSEMEEEDFYEVMKERMKNFRSTKNNQLLQEKEDTLNMTELVKSQPLIDRFMHLGNWSFHFLQALGHIHSTHKLHKLKSLLPKDQRNLDEDELDFSKLAISLSRKSSFVLNLLLQVKGRAKNLQQVEDYEVFLEYDPKKYRAPGLALLNATKHSLSAKQTQEEILPLPPLPLLSEKDIWLQRLREYRDTVLPYREVILVSCSLGMLLSLLLYFIL